MAIRPVVLVIQETVNTSTSPVTPDLNVLIVGPCYWILTYADNKEDIKLDSNFGTLESANPYTLPSDLVITDVPNNKVGATLDADSVKVYLDNARVRILNGASDLGVASSGTPNVFTITGSYNMTTGNDKVLPGDRFVLTSSAAETVARTVLSVDSALQVSFTADLPASGFTYNSSVIWRVERRLNDQLLDDSFATVSGNQVTLESGATLPVTGQGNKSVAYGEVYVQYRSLRADLTALHTINSTDEIEGVLGLIDPSNPLALGVFTAMQNTTSPVQAVAVDSDDLVGYTKARDTISSRKDIYAIVPLTTSTSVLAMWKTHVEGVALPDETLGSPQRFRVVIGSSELPVTETVIQEQTDGGVSAVASTAPSTIAKLTCSSLNFVTGNVIPGDHVLITADANGVSRVGTYTVASVTSATVLEVNSDGPFAAAASANITIAVKDSTETVTRIAAVTGTSGVTAALDDLFLQLTDANGTFISSGVAAGDILEMPADPTGGDYTHKNSWVIASITSDNRLRIVNNGTDSSTLVNELPHGAKRSGGALVGATNLRYRVTRVRDRASQIDALISQSQSFNSRRVVMVWPDSVLLPDIEEAQPGYYLGCVVGGMTAGLPSHQGFTNIGVAGVSQLLNSNTYFTDDQLSELSQGGWYVFQQDTTASLPYSIHQLTTDPDTLESGEYSVVKNFDFVSLFFSDIVDDFLGQYNVNDELLGLIRSALETGIDTLRLRRFAKIGAPLNSGRVNSVAVSTTSADRVIVSMDVGLPRPLNVIELHLLA